VAGRRRWLVAREGGRCNLYDFGDGYIRSCVIMIGRFALDLDGSEVYVWMCLMYYDFILMGCQNWKNHC
jgi:hypothetical protein